jgi:hypothetical protein
MKALLITLFALFSAVAFAEEAPISGGKVICSQISPSTTGFELINILRKNRDYVGAAQIGNLKFSGTYYAPRNSFELSVNTMDEDGIENGLVLSLETELRSGQFFHAKTALGDGLFEIYCYYIQQTK